MAHDWYFLSLRKIKWLMAYYIVLIIIGLPGMILCLLHESFNYDCLDIVELGLIGGAGSALTGCSIFYLRKLYKSCINQDMNNPNNELDKIRELGIYAYFFLRPLFAIIFSLLVHLILRSSVDVIAAPSTKLSEGFIYLSIFLSFFVGFAAGDVVTYIENKSKELGTSIFSRG